MSDRFRCFVLHAERLERDDVWTATGRLLRSLVSAGGRATLFVHPFSAIEQGVDLGPRLRQLTSAGHEVGQHTHFYAPHGADHSAPPTSDLSPDNVRRCLDRDLTYLHAAQVRPRGFTSGGWAIVPEAAAWLLERGFTYDSSDRSFDLSYSSDAAEAGGGATGAVARDGIVRLPTTSSVRIGIGSALRCRDLSLPGPGFRYDLAYAHDYDLVVPRRRIAASALVRAWRSGPWRTAGELAQLVREGTS